MKKATFTLLLSLYCCWLAAQCPTSITFSTQGQIDSFQINYPGCTDMPWTVKIEGNDITNLDGLSVLDSINGCLWISNNPVLTSLQGLENLTYVGGCEFLFTDFGLNIWSNPMLTSLEGLDNLKSVKACVSISGNPSLSALNGLDNLSTLGTGMKSSSDPHSTYSLSISGNTGLKTIGGFASLDSLYILEISYNDSLLSLNGLENIRTVGKLYVGYNPSLPNFKGLDSLQTAGRLYIEFNDALQNFEGLEKLSSIDCHSSGIQEGLQSLHVESNFSLIDFSGLENVQNIGCGGYSIVKIINNWSLQSLTGLSATIDSLIELTIQGNNLPICGIQPICDFLENGGFATISNNAPGCNSIAEVEAACIVSIEETLDGEPAVVFSPNPAGDFLQIQIKEPEKWDISLFDLQGRQMFRQAVFGSQIIDLKDWPSGIYALRAVSGGRVFSGKIVKQ